MILKSITRLIAFAIITNTAFAAGEGWMTDFEAAKKKAAAENKDLLLEFTGSDWCPPCKKLNKNVFSKPEFVKSASEKFVLVALDYPRKKQLPAAEKAQNEKLSSIYGINAFPTVLLCDADGVPYARTGYQPGGPEEYMTSLNAMLPAKEKFQNTLAEANKLEGKAKADALWAALNSLKGIKIGLSFDPILQTIKAADPENSNAKVDGIYINAEMASLKEGDDYKPLFKKYDTYLDNLKVTGEKKQQMLIQKINVLYKMKDFDGMRTLTDEIVAVAPDSRIGKGMKASKPRIDMLEDKYKKQQAAKK